MPVSGQIALMGLLEWLQVLELNRRTVSVRLRRHAESGWLSLIQGRLVHARCAGLTGDAAARTLLTWTDAHLEQQPLDTDTDEDVTRPIQDLMLDVMDAVPPPPPTDPGWRVYGDLTGMSVVELLQLVELNRRRCTIQVRGDVAADLAAEEGLLGSATCGGLTGEDAVYAALAARNGTFEIAPADGAPPASFVGNVWELLIEGVRRADEARLIEGQSVPDPDPTEQQLLHELDAGQHSPTVRLMMARRYQPRGQATPVPVVLRLAEDEEQRVQQAAYETLDHLPANVRQTIAENPATPPPVRKHLRIGLSGVARTDDDLPPDEEYPRGIHARIHRLSMADKMYMAHHGSRYERLVLMRHPCSRVAMAAYEASLASESDVEVIAGATSANTDVLNAIAREPRYNHNYKIARLLVFNPKTPAKRSAQLVRQLRQRDLMTAKDNMDLSEAVRSAVHKRLKALEIKRRF